MARKTTDTATAMIGMSTARPLHYRLLFKLAADNGGLRNLLAEVIRNALFHGLAQNVYIETRGAGRKLELIVVDDGNGMTEDGRRYYGKHAGCTTGKGNGNGGRFAAVTLCQVIEAITLPVDEPGWAYQLTMHLPTFFVGLTDGTWTAEWTRVPRVQTPFPNELKNGTMIIFRDFRASSAEEPLNETKMRDTSRLISRDEIRRLVPIVLTPDLARKVFVDKTRIQSPDIGGFPLWSMHPPKEIPGLGVVSGDVRLSNESEGRWCTIGGTTMSVPIRNFVDDCRANNPTLAEHIPPELCDRRNAGFLRIGVMESYPTPGREHVDPAFWSTADGATVVKFLETRVGPEIQASRRKYESQPATEETRASLSRVVARLHQAQGIRPGAGKGGGGDVVRLEDAPLEVNRVSVRLEVVRGQAAADAWTFKITNPLPGETFKWNDHGEGLLEQTSGEQATVHAIHRVGVYPIEVQSNSFPHRRRTLNVDIREPSQSRPEDEFLLVPMLTSMSVGEEKPISVRSEGPSSGKYRWAVKWTREGKSSSVDCFTVQPGGHRIIFKPVEHGDYTVACTDQRNTSLVATSQVEVFAQQPVVTVPPPIGTEEGGGEGVGGNGTRRSPVTREEFVLSFEGTDFRLHAVPYLERPWGLEPQNKIILISDVHPANSCARSPEERDRHISWCLAAAIMAYQVQVNALTADDFEGMSRIHDKVLRQALLHDGRLTKETAAKVEAAKSGRAKVHAT